MSGRQPQGDTGRSRLTQDQKNQIRYWISLGCDLAACYSQEKNRYKERWGEEKTRYIEILEAEGTKLHAGERHPGTVAMAASMFFRYTGSLDRERSNNPYKRGLVYH